MRTRGGLDETRQVIRKARAMMKEGIPLREVIDSIRSEYEAEGLGEVIEDVLEALADVGDLMPRWRRRSRRETRSRFGGREHTVRVVVEEHGDGRRDETVEVEADDGEDEEGFRKEAAKRAGKVLREALRQNASDIHLEPTRQGGVIRYRVDGKLREARVIEAEEHGRLIARLKQMACLDEDLHDLPQDGKVLLSMSWDDLEPEDIELRVAIGPSARGEAACVRILRRKNIEATFQDPGCLFSDPECRELATKLAAEPFGLVFVTGPTGCGKTSTLYGLVSMQDAGTTKVMTVEEPIEVVDLPGVHQVPVRPAKGMSFPAAIRHCLRMDPDVLYCSEVREEETATLLMKAALTGHLVFSCLHGQDVIESTLRLLDIGLEPYLLADALRGMIGQRLLRRLCPECKAPSPEDTARARDTFGDLLPADAELWAAPGCAACEGRGFRGRMALQEVLVAGPETRKAIGGRPDADGLLAAARKDGFVPMIERGVEALVQKKTSLAEVLRCVPRR